MNWREAVITALADGDWHLAGQVFSQIETAIPMHIATRQMAHRHADNVVRKSPTLMTVDGYVSRGT